MVIDEGVGSNSGPAATVRVEQGRWAARLLPWVAVALVVFGVLRLGWIHLQRRTLNPLLFTAVAEENTPAAMALLGAGANPNVADENGFSALHQAILIDDVPMVRMLLRAGAAIDAPEPRRGETPLMTAAGCGRREIVGILLDAGAKVNARGKGGITALAQAAVGRSVGAHRFETVRLLLKRGADPWVRAGDGRTPLDCAQDAGHAESAHLLRGAMKR